MTDAISTDLAKLMASTKPAAKAPDKPAAKAPGADKAGDPSPPPPGSKTFLGWVARSITKKQLVIAGAAALSLVAGIALVRFVSPEEDKANTGTTQLYVSEPTAPATTPPAPRTGPTLTIDPPRPGDFIPATGLSIPPVVPPAPSYGTVPPPSGVIIPPAPGSAPSTPGGVIIPPAPGTGTGSIPPPAGLESLPVIPIPGVGPSAPVAPSAPSSVVPAGGISPIPLPPPASGGSLPAVPPVVPPSLPAIPGTGTSSGTGSGTIAVPPPPSDLSRAEPKPPPPITGMPPSTSLPAPSGGSGIIVPPAPMDLNPSGSGAKIEFIKPADNSAVLPIAGSTRLPTTSYDVDIYHPKPNDTWESVSREFYSDTKYAGALRSYNEAKNQSLSRGTVDVPPIHVLRGMSAPPVAGTPAGRAPSDPWAASGAPGTSSGPKTYRVPNGDGMSLPAVAKLLLGNDQRWKEIYDLNPEVNPNRVPAGTDLKLPADARVQ
jgi:hypothetical protein